MIRFSSFCTLAQRCRAFRMARVIALSLGLGLSLAACTTPSPPRPAMQALSVAGNFGFSDRDIDADTVEVTYRGAQINISASAPRDDPSVLAEKQKVRDLALLRAAHLAQERGMSALRIVNEKTDSDIDQHSYPRCRPAPFWGGPGYWGYPYGYGYGYRSFYGGWPDDYICTNRRSANVKTTAVLTVDLIAHPVADDQDLSTTDTISRLEKIYAGATYR